jgi:uncharacterized membrane protein
MLEKTVYLIIFIALIATSIYVGININIFCGILIGILSVIVGLFMMAAIAFGEAVEGCIKGFK